MIYVNNILILTKNQILVIFKNTCLYYFSYLMIGFLLKNSNIVDKMQKKSTNLHISVINTTKKAFHSGKPFSIIFL